MLELLGPNRLDVGIGSDRRRRRSHLLRDKAPVKSVVCPRDLVVRMGSPTLGKRLPEAIEQALGERIKRHRVEAAGVCAVTTLAHTGREVGRRVALETDRENAPWSGSRAGLQKEGGALGEELSLASAGASDDGAVLG